MSVELRENQQALVYMIHNVDQACSAQVQMLCEDHRHCRPPNATCKPQNSSMKMILQPLHAGLKSTVTVTCVQHIKCAELTRLQKGSQHESQYQ